MKHAVIYEKVPKGEYSAYAPDLPGSVAASPTLAETRNLMEDSIEFPYEGLRLDGGTVPELSCVAEMIEVA